MDPETARERLDRLASEPNLQSIAGQLRKLLPQIERALEAGATRERIYRELKAAGLDMTFGTFSSTLTRVRAGARTRAAGAPARPPRRTTPAPPGTPAGAPPAPDPSDPASLDQVLERAPNLNQLAKQARRSKL